MELGVDTRTPSFSVPWPQQISSSDGDHLAGHLAPLERPGVNDFKDIGTSVGLYSCYNWPLLSWEQWHFSGYRYQSQLIAMFSGKVYTTDSSFYLLINSNLLAKFGVLNDSNGAWSDGKVPATMNNMLCSPFFGYHFDMSHKYTFHSSNNVCGAIWLSEAKASWVFSKPYNNKTLVSHTSHRSTSYQ